MIQGLLGKKVGMTHLFGTESRVIPVTVLEVGPCVVTQVQTDARNGYNAVQIGFGTAKQLSKPASGHLKAAGAQSRHLREFRVADISEYTVGQTLPVTQFQAGDLVDITSTSKGRGFQGVMKRHGFGGGKKTHGQGDRGRAPGSIGAGTYPGRVLKGKKMPGHMGNRRVTTRRLRVEMVDPERNLLMIRGAVPGARETLLSVNYSKGTALADRLTSEEWTALISGVPAGVAVEEAPPEEPATEPEAAVEPEAVTAEAAAEEAATEPEAAAESEAVTEEAAAEEAAAEPEAVTEEAAVEEAAAETEETKEEDGEKA